MSYRKGEDTFAKKRRRLPFKVLIDRTEPFCRADEQELEAECRRITNGAEFLHSMERTGSEYWHVVRFGSEHQAEAFRSFVHRSELMRRPVPQYGPSKAEREAFRQKVMLWGFRTGAIRRVLKAWRNTRGSLTQCDTAARNVIETYRVPEGCDSILTIFIEWCAENHPGWLEHRPPPGWLPFEEFHWVMPQDAYPHSEDE